MATTIEYLCPNCTTPLDITKFICRCGHFVVDSPIGVASRPVNAIIAGSDGPPGRYASFGDGNDVDGSETIADGGTIDHGLGAIPTHATVTATVSGEIAYITSMSATQLTVAIKTAAGAAGTTQSITWTAQNIFPT